MLEFKFEIGLRWSRTMNSDYKIRIQRIYNETFILDFLPFSNDQLLFKPQF